MPFRSEKQRRFLWLKHPDIAKRWAKKYGSKVARRKSKVSSRKGKGRRVRGR